MPWSPLFTRRKQSVCVAAAQNAQLMSIEDGVELPIKFRFVAGAFLEQTGTLTTPEGVMSTVCVG
jgi:hypothetical protein